jgi:phage tail sheath protein FI
MGYLEGDVSAASNETGFAVFSELKIMGSNSRFVYIFFTCDGVTVSPWAKTKPETYVIYDLPYYIPPIKIISSVDSIEIFLEPSSKVVEGEVLSQ